MKTSDVNADVVLGLSKSVSKIFSVENSLPISRRKKILSFLKWSYNDPN